MYKKILWNKFSFWCFIFLLIQQMIVASSTFWITNLSEAVVVGKDIVFYLSLFVSSLFLVYIPGIFSNFFLEKAKSQAFLRYTQEFSEKYTCSPDVLTEKQFQEEREPWLTNESNRTIEETYSVVYDSAATGLNTSLNILALCIAIDRRMIFGYIASFIFLSITCSLFKNKIANASIILQNDRKSMSQTLLSGWDNILIGNAYNFSIWWKIFTNRWASYNNSSAKAVLIMQISSTSAAIFSLLPVACIFLWIFMTSNDTAKLAALVATLPRQIQIIQHFEILSTYTMHWHAMYAKLKALVATIVSPKHDKNKLLSRIKENEIKYTINKTQRTLQSFDHLFKVVSIMKNGRITIEGSNGSGKTTLITLLKKELGNSAYLLPANSRLIFKSTIEDNFSTGQRVKVYLEELESLFLCPTGAGIPNLVLLLDEWDANLDSKNKKDISEMLDRLSNQHCVVEISHRCQDNIIQKVL